MTKMFLEHRGGESITGRRWANFMERQAVGELDHGVMMRF